MVLVVSIATREISIPPMYFGLRFREGSILIDPSNPQWI
jgi:hypothetical protein